MIPQVQNATRPSRPDREGPLRAPSGPGGAARESVRTGWNHYGAGPHLRVASAGWTSVYSGLDAWGLHGE